MQSNSAIRIPLQSFRFGFLCVLSCVRCVKQKNAVKLLRAEDRQNRSRKLLLREFPRCKRILRIHEREQQIKLGLRFRGLRVMARFFLWSLDRKSTRLNSSHLVISYAVFCLKKKK